MDSAAVVFELITPEPSARNLGVILDTHLSLNDHIAKGCKTSRLHLRNIGKIRKFLTKESTEILTHAFVGSCQLKTGQNTVARVVSFARKYDHNTPVLQSFHCLPIQSRIIFKILLFSLQST